MSAKHVILCGGARLSARASAWKSLAPTKLKIGSGAQDVHLHLHDLTKPMSENPSDIATDLLEIAAFIYAADQAVTRGGKSEFEYGTKWRRHLWFEIPVRQPDHWNSTDVLTPLQEVLCFLSDDDYELHFTKLRNPPKFERYLDFRKDGIDSGGIEEVMLFSGGLDSFAGAVNEIAGGQRKVALVSHEPTTKVGAPQRTLIGALNTHLNGSAPAPLHVQVELNKGKALGKEYTQRTRSFVYAALASVVARMLGRDRLRFYENGIVSFNLPLSMQALGGRASRTTHPQTLSGLGRLLSAVYERPFTVENPFLWKTKTELFRELKSGGFGRLCASTISCAHTWERTKQHTHCGRCSQCVDRRVVAIAAEMGPDEDPPEMYERDLVTSPWTVPEDVTLIERYLGANREMGTVATPIEFMARYGETAKALRHAGPDPKTAAERVHELHRRHASQVSEAVVRMIQVSAARFFNHEIPTNSFPGIAVGLDKTGSHTAGAAPPSASDEGLGHHPKPTAVRSTFTAHYGYGRCFLGNSVEFRLFERLARSPGHYIANGTLMKDVWDDQIIASNTIARHASSLRRRLKESGISGLEIDGKQKGHYRLTAS